MPRLPTRSHDHPCSDLSLESHGTATRPRHFMRSDYFLQSGSLQIGSPRSEKHCWPPCRPRGLRMRCPTLKPRANLATSFLVTFVSPITPQLTSITTSYRAKTKIKSPIASRSVGGLAQRVFCVASPANSRSRRTTPAATLRKKHSASC